MSNVMRSEYPASRPTSARADDAGRWAGQHRAHRQPRRLSEADHPAVRLRQMRHGAHAQAGQPVAETLDVALHHRAQIGVHHGGGHPLDTRGIPARPGARRRRRLRETPPPACATPPLRAPAARNCRGSTPRPPAPRPRAELRTAARNACCVQWHFDRAVVPHPLRHLDAQVARHQHRRLVGLQVVEVGPLLPADLQQVAEPVGGDQPGAHAAMLDQRVGRHGRAVTEIADRTGGGADQRQALRRRPRRCRATDRPASRRPSKRQSAPVSSSNRQTSVKVPPESTPMRHATKPCPTPKSASLARDAATCQTRPECMQGNRVKEARPGLCPWTPPGGVAPQPSQRAAFWNPSLRAVGREGASAAAVPCQIGGCRSRTDAAAHGPLPSNHSKRMGSKGFALGGGSGGNSPLRGPGREPWPCFFHSIALHAFGLPCRRDYGRQ